MRCVFSWLISKRISSHFMPVFRTTSNSSYSLRRPIGKLSLLPTSRRYVALYNESHDSNCFQTSITIDDIIYVIDSGKVKENQYDPVMDISRLTETQVTQAAARQRRGRAGRTQPGVCYKLFTRRQESDMGEFPVPEILRVPLEKTSLTIRLMREDEDVKVTSHLRWHFRGFTSSLAIPEPGD
jgi:hypothetical protein